ncbi:hypothetical protein CC1_32290 [Coprococcus catus GD/7]|jgi:hypothetical protein|uniref:Uncharacterized protein n=1 Tax=Coprococcus catus GD/7 TaxID=717962 RepID=D4JBQ0_9FIRM|nr:hypothetical protein CC1_32290 [Coprococcus catus GD/7]
MKDEKEAKKVGLGKNIAMTKKRYCQKVELLILQNEFKVG